MCWCQLRLRCDASRYTVTGSEDGVVRLWGIRELCEPMVAAADGPTSSQASECTLHSESDAPAHLICISSLRIHEQCSIPSTCWSCTLHCECAFFADVPNLLIYPCTE